ncbi:MAG: 16S rRNA processing protein RimM [Clostridia bacterium]|nr:MAG: 16S rRNA processing protein RimM [Clostridia bacterium]
MKPEGYIAVGEILGPHGVHGEVKVRPLTDFPERFYRLETVRVRLGGEPRPYTVEQCRVLQGHTIIIRFVGVSDREAAATLRGGLIEIPPEEVVPLPEGHYYVFQLVGLPVYTVEGELLGRLKDVLSTGANDVYVVADDRTNKEILLPAIREVIKEVDLDGEKMIIDPLPGLLE